jgi:hypothetical protein
MQNITSSVHSFSSEVVSINELYTLPGVCHWGKVLLWEMESGVVEDPYAMAVT